MNGSQKFAAVVLAADRTGADPVTITGGVSCKAFVPVLGTPMVIRVLDALENSGMISRIYLCGPPESLLPQCPALLERLQGERIQWLPNQASPAGSAEHCLQQMAEETPVLLTTADHALLTPEMVRHFLDASTGQDADATVALVEYRLIKQAFPDARRTVTRLRDGEFCGCNLYALLTPGGRSLAAFWKQVEQERKHPRKWISRLFGPATAIAYLFGRLTLERGLAALSDRTGVRIRPVIMPFPEAATDVDKPEDLELAEAVLSRKENN